MREKIFLIFLRFFWICFSDKCSMWGGGPERLLKSDENESGLIYQVLRLCCENLENQKTKKIIGDYSLVINFSVEALVKVCSNGVFFLPNRYIIICVV